MKMRNLLIGLGCFTTSIMMAQGPLHDRIEVNLPYPVTINNTVLQPGDYVIRQHDSAAGGSRILHFFSDQGMKLETTAMAIPALDNRTPEDTKLVLEHIGSDYYLNKVWVQGKNYGYEFPIPASVRMREQERSAATVVARYEPTTVTKEETRTEETRTEETKVAETETKTEVQNTEIAQNTPPPPPIETQPEPTPQAAPEPAPAPVEMADRGERTMPATSANWLNLLFGGTLLAGSGFCLRRVRS